jgi:hypothetical protein
MSSKSPSGVLVAANICDACRFGYDRYEGGCYSYQCGLWGREVLPMQEWDSPSKGPRMAPVPVPSWCVLPVTVLRGGELL